MLKIFIFDNDPKYIDFIKNYITMSDINMQLADIDKLMDNIKYETRLYFIDIGENLGGITLAETIRIYDQVGYIVFIAQDESAYKFIFKHKIEALDYIIKNDPYIKERIHESLEYISKKLANTALQNNILFTLSEDTRNFLKNIILAKDSILSININEIICIMTTPNIHRMVTVYTIQGSFPAKGCLTQIESNINDIRFYRCQNNAIINLDKIRSIDPIQRILTLENDIIINIAARKIKKLISHISEYENNTLVNQKDEYHELILDELPLDNKGEIDIARILKENGFSHINIKKNKIKVINVPLFASNENKNAITAN